LIKKKKRFSLVFLEEGEIYTRDCMGFRQHPGRYPEKRQEKGRIHLCSRSLIFEPQDRETPLVRYSYRDMSGPPEEIMAPRSLYAHTSNATRVTFYITKITELPDLRSPLPYKTIQLQQPQNVLLDFEYESVTSMNEWINNLYERNAGHNAGFDQDSELADLVTQRERGIRFDMSRIESITERPIIQAPMLVKRVHPFMSVPGLLYITDIRLYFQPVYQVSANPVKSIRHTDVCKIHKRRWKLRNVGFEIFTRDNKTLFLSFYTERERDQILGLLLGLAGPECETENSVENTTLKWQLRQISNYDYLLYLNSAAYRTFSDFTQYPVFPWVLSNYDSPELDLNNAANFRNLSLPIGALNPNRLATFKKRYTDMPEPKFLYGTHYSAPGYVIGFLFRRFPLFMLRLHSGKFDSPDRLFNDIAQDWRSVQDNPADVKELIPEFYSDDPSFLQNDLALDLGIKMNGEKVWDVKLPPWAADSRDFLKKMREALESPYVSENLHHWIDLIFGYKQRGEHAFNANNIFHPLTYEGSVDIDSISDPIQKRAIELQIHEFGQTPKQLFKIPHPPRHMVQEEEKEIVKPLKTARMTWNIENVARKSSSQVTEITLHKKRVSSIHKIGDRAITTAHDGCLKVTALERVQKRSFPICELAISCSALINDKTIAAGSYDNRIYIFNLSTGRVINNFQAHDDAITSCEYIESLNAIASGSWDGFVKL